MNLDFSNKKLVSRFGSWPRVQVAFYDFIFQVGCNMCPKHFRETAKAEALSGKFAEGEDLYERTVSNIEEIFKNPDEAWKAFLEDLKKEEH